MQEFKKITDDAFKVLALATFYLATFVVFPEPVLSPNIPVKIYEIDQLDRIASTSKQEINLLTPTQNQLPKFN